MGVFSVPNEVGNLDSQGYESLEALVDTGATYLVVPRPILDSLGVKASERWPFQLADGREVDFDVGDVLLRLNGREHTVLAVFGEEGTQALLGAVVLEALRLIRSDSASCLLPAY